MIFSTSYKISSMLLSLLVLFSTFSFTIEKHYCGENLVDIAIFSEVKKCQDMDIDEVVYVKKSCCKDTVDVFEGQDDLSNYDFENFHKTLKLNIVSYIYSYNKIYESLPKQVIPHKDYSPPKIITDIHLLDEIFLI